MNILLSKLESGYYWIKLNSNSDWSIAYFNATERKFNLIGTENKISSPTVLDSNKIEKFNEFNKTKFLFDKLNELNINESFDKGTFIRQLWNKDDFFNTRSFDVLFVKNKKELKPKTFRAIRGQITRIS